MSIATRTDDETVLTWLALRDRGIDTLNIAKRYGTTSERIRTATNRVRAQDIAADPVAANFYAWKRDNTQVPA